MRVDFRDPLGQMRHEPRKPRLGHGAAPGEAKNLIRRADARSPEARALNARQRRVSQGREMRASRLDLSEDRARLERRANRRRPELLRELDDR